MKDTNIFIQRNDGSKRQIDWVELNLLKKDILWMFDENGKELQHAFVPEYSFTLPYWEYATINGDKYFYDEQKHFYRQGSLIVILCMIAEYIDIQGGNQMVFGDNKVERIVEYISRFEPLEESQNKLKQIVIMGLSIATSIT